MFAGHADADSEGQDALTGDIDMVIGYELRFQSLFDSGRGYAFPCTPSGEVELDKLSEQARNNYLYARAMVGRELAVPAVRPMAMH
jgi:hypothetical protein